MNIDDLAKLISPSQAARILQISPDRVRQLLRCGTLAGVRTANGTLLRPDDVEQLRMKRAHAAAAAVE